MHSKGLCRKHYLRLYQFGRLSNIHNTGEGDSPEERFWSKVDKTKDCWNWIGYCQPKGYGQVGFEGRLLLAHRVSWFYKHGVFPNKILMHSCDNRKCVNPDHLREGTCKENSEDMVLKGRSARGTKARAAKLDEQKVIEIRKKLDLGVRNIQLCSEYDISPSVVSMIKSKKIWKHVS
jgi:hypothetical protein